MGFLWNLNDVDKRSDSSYLRTKLKKPLNRYFLQHENPKINEIYPDIVDLPIFNDASCSQKYSVDQKG